MVQSIQKTEKPDVKLTLNEWYQYIYDLSKKNNNNIHNETAVRYKKH